MGLRVGWELLDVGVRVSVQASRQREVEGEELTVCAFSRLLQLQSKGHLALRQVKHVVVDEADEMLLRGFARPLEDILGRSGGGRAPQLALVSATLGGEARREISRRWPHVSMLISPCAHRSPPSLRHLLHEFSGDKMVRHTLPYPLHLTAPHRAAPHLASPHLQPNPRFSPTCPTSPYP